MYASQQTSARSRRGITLLEVLISIGILSIGLASVVALIPAGQSQASRAVVLDRAAVLAANVLADAATFGILRPTSVANGFSRPLVIDAAGATLSGCFAGGLGTLGIYEGNAPGAAAAAVQNLFLQSRDDIVSGTATGHDDPPLNAAVDGTRAFTGRMSCLLCLQAGSSNAPDRMSAVVFHRRDPSFTTLTGTLTSGTLVVPSSQATLLGSRLVADVIKPGVVVFTPSSAQFHQVTSARIDTVTAVNGSTQGVYGASMTFSTGTAGQAITTGTTPTMLQFLPESVGLAERPFTREMSGAYAQ